jgi:hypothetical protein
MPWTIAGHAIGTAIRLVDRFCSKLQGLPTGGTMRAVTKKMFGAVAVITLIGVGYSTLRSDSGDSSKLLVGRIWLDHLPTKDTEHFEVFVAVEKEPVGVFQRASQFEGAYAMFRYELRGDDKVQLLFPQDKSKHEVRYKAAACNVKGFDYCLEIEGAPRGAKRYLSRKEWELEGQDPAALRAQIDAWRASLPLSPESE